MQLLIRFAPECGFVISGGRGGGGGQGGIRTLDGREPILVFETSAFNLSATCPYMGPKRGKPLYKGARAVFQGFVGGLFGAQFLKFVNYIKGFAGA